MSNIREIAKRISEKIGLNIYAIKNRFAIGYPFFKYNKFNTIIDAGANVGQFVLKFYPINPQAKFYSFEPLKSCFKQLKSNTGKFKNIYCHNYALGDKNETIEINSNEFSPASSILENSDSQNFYMPYTANSSKEKIETKRLDDLQESITLEKPVLLKIDVQGYEAHLLNGAKNFIKNVDCILIELSLEELYKGQPLFNDIYTMLNNEGFTYVGNFDQQISKKNGRILQVDAIFIRKNSTIN